MTRERLKQTVLFGLADELRDETADARVNALRRSVLIKPATDLLDQWEFEEPHRRGEVLVAAILNAFLDAWVGPHRGRAAARTPGWSAGSASPRKARRSPSSC